MKTFKDFLNESPFLDSHGDKDYYNTSVRNSVLSSINKSYGGETHKISNNVYKHVTKQGDHVYHCKENDDVKEVLSVTQSDNDNVIEFMSKHNGNKQGIIDLIHHALKDHGHLTTDNIHSKGAKNFWMNIHDHFPDHKIIHIDNTGSEQNASKEYIRKHQSSIWNTNDGTTHKLRIYSKK